MGQELSAHNASVLGELEEGDMVQFPRGVYSHWGVYVGHGRMIHLTLDNGGINGSSSDPKKLFAVCGITSSKGYVKEEEFRTVAAGTKAKKNNDKDSRCSPLSAREIIRRAREKLGRLGYNALWKNCEHFAAFCRYGVAWSQQADYFLTGAAVAGVVAALGYIGWKSMKKDDKKGK